MVVLLALFVMALWYFAKKSYGSIDDADTGPTHEHSGVSRELLAVPVVVPNAEIKVASASIAAKKNGISTNNSMEMVLLEEIIKRPGGSQNTSTHEHIEELHRAVIGQENTIQIANRWFLYGQESKAVDAPPIDAEQNMDLWSMAVATPLCMAYVVYDPAMLALVQCCNAIAHEAVRLWSWLVSIADAAIEIVAAPNIEAIISIELVSYDWRSKVGVPEVEQNRDKY
ncbi:MAG: hypothetical protein JSS50_01105 [Proteobacteria bacterium]|nr:hypothetical protein [Pseudomonadota bacterium]